MKFFKIVTITARVEVEAINVDEARGKLADAVYELKAPGLNTEIYDTTSCGIYTC